LDDLFNRIGPVLKLSLTYDRAGRSEGVAYVTYESAQDAKAAVREFDGANAKGQPIRHSDVSGPAPTENEEKELEADVVAVVLQIVLLVMEDLAKLRKNSMPRWRITGDRRKMALARKLLLQRLLLLMETTST